MKKVWAVLLALASVAAMAGCSKPGVTVSKGELSSASSAVAESSEKAGETSEPEGETSAESETEPTETAEGGESAEETTGDESGTTESGETDTAALFGSLSEQFSCFGFQWGTTLHIHSDGSFEADYHSLSKTKKGEEYPNGTDEIASFEGTFTDVQKVDNNCYSMTVTALVVTSETGSEEIEDGVRKVCVDYTGKMSEGSEIMLFNPDTPVSLLPDGFLGGRKPAGIPDGKVLGGYCFRVDGSTVYYSQNK